MVVLNMMEEEFHACRIKERWHAAFFDRQCEMDREEYKERWEEERACKCEKAWRAKEAYEWGGDEVLRKAKWLSLTQDWWTGSFLVYRCVVLNL
jgi:hypothetical protein